MTEGWKWLDSTKELQEKSFGIKYPLEGEELAAYVTWNHSALVQEAGELLAEFGWKPWATNRGWVNRELALKEAVDVAHFLGNFMVAIGVTDEEWKTAYQAKQQVNRDRMASGTYDAVSSKCSLCKRAYDDDIDCLPAEPRDTGDPAYCAVKRLFVVNEEETCSGCGYDYADSPHCYSNHCGRTKSHTS